MNTDTKALLNDLDGTRRQIGGVSRTTLYEIFERGELVPVKIGRRVFVPQTEIDRYVALLSERAAVRQEAKGA